MTLPPAAAREAVETGRWELVRALGSIVDTRPDQSARIVEALDLPPLEVAEHTATFVLWCPPYAAAHLGPEGKLGGVGADRVAGFWRALGLTPPSEPDHLAHLLALYAHLGSAEQESHGPAASKLAHARSSLLAEHLWSWAPGYLGAVEDLGGSSLSRWAVVTREVLRREVRSTGPGRVLPLALREAPDPLGAELGPDQLLDEILSPIRSGMVLTHPSLAAIAHRHGTGYRAGERRFALRAMLEQDAAATLDGLVTEARRWVRRHQAEARVDPGVAGWWTERARSTAAALATLAARAVGAPIAHFSC